ncbi:hypothetical protein E2C01_099935 [Portunus trituberculatus]|uniref:Uncharacterized protein n=1 Tax=Portunus trituberculatus TaxID=210409 RepID=A0A5B7KC74_PORTR|nr:hypothetical protein [Portunus trituberculatus]
MRHRRHLLQQKPHFTSPGTGTKTTTTRTSNPDRGPGRPARTRRYATSFKEQAKTTDGPVADQP